MLELIKAPPTAQTGQPQEAGARSLYFALGSPTVDQAQRERGRAYLDSQLVAASHAAGGLPDDSASLASWVGNNAEEVGQAYSAYLAGRRGGEARRYFPTKAHALAFLQNAAPTKLVDGAWLYGTVERWNDAEFRPLLTTYLEELGEGIPEKNHVLLYKKLLECEGCTLWQDLPDTHFVQGAIQLALACNAQHFLPELIGFNLGYEQLPLHLLITAYELNELGIDPYYFTLHVTVDNRSTGHALRAVQALHSLTPRVGDARAFYRRVQNGYRLNELGLGSTELIARFDLEAELLRLLSKKSAAGKNMHSDYCRVAGRTVNDWLADPAHLPSFLDQLTKSGWIQRGMAAEQSRFWRLIQGDKAEMFGVFSAYEQQVLRDWIEHAPSCRATSEEASRPARVISYRARRRAQEAGGAGSEAVGARGFPLRPVIRHHVDDDASLYSGFGADLRRLEQRLATMGSKAQAMQFLVALMSPATHHSAAGLMATRIFHRMLD